MHLKFTFFSLLALDLFTLLFNVSLNWDFMIDLRMVGMTSLNCRFIVCSKSFYVVFNDFKMESFYFVASFA